MYIPTPTEYAEKLHREYYILIHIDTEEAGKRAEEFAIFCKGYVAHLAYHEVRERMGE
jgi:hypothetical protein